MEEPTAAQRLQETQAVRDMTYARLTELHVQAHAHGMLSVEADAERAMLERRMVDLEPYLERLKQEVARERVLIDVGAIEAEWDILRQRKHEAYEEFDACVSDMRTAFHHILTIHGAQYALSQRAPRDIQDKWNFQDPGTLANWITGRMVPPMAWQQILIGWQGHGWDLKNIMDVDTGTKVLPRVLTDLKKKEN